MKTLDEIALKYGTDKSSRKHNYTKLYAAYFEALRDKPITILEIGIANGHSLLTWKEYFIKAKLVGADIEDCKELEQERIYTEKGDQSDPAFLAMINKKHGPFDIIIDDGSHRNPDMKASFDCLFPLLKPDGIYVVEDLHMCYWGKTHGAGEPVFIDKIKELVDYVNSSGKSGTGNHALDATDAYHLNNKTVLSWWEDAIQFMHLYRSIVFIKKYPAKIEGSTYVVDMPRLLDRTRRKVRFMWKRVSELTWAKQKTGGSKAK
ncbi:MAG: class I SAM-dependent methyltransferase [Candidatus Pacebacteria bacterium]|nr:class I SAM-dependent methyltransferase [Candidatus Paceibacterota bacterium]